MLEDVQPNSSFQRITCCSRNAKEAECMERKSVCVGRCQIFGEYIPTSQICLAGAVQATSCLFKLHGWICEFKV